jgi:tricarballylate dehydrogenase
VAIVGGGNAALCAAMAASDEGAEVMVFERAPRDFRGGNTRHTRNLRALHQQADAYVTGPYPLDEFKADLAGVTEEEGLRPLAELTIIESEAIVPWMEAHGARWQAPLKGTLGLARTNHFFLGGGKSLLNGYYRYAESAGVSIAYDATVEGLPLEGNRCSGLQIRGADGSSRRVEADAVVVAAGGFEANREWLARYWGAAAETLIVRGTRYNDGKVLRLLMDADALTVGPPMGAHAIAVDARAPAYDGGIITRLDAIPIGIVVNANGDRFNDEGEDVWPKRYATWGRLVAEQPSQIAHVIFDAKVAGETIPGLYPPIQATGIEDLAVQLGLDGGRLAATVEDFNRHCVPGRFDLSDLDECHTRDLEPPKSHWARPIDTPPYFAYPMRPGITFTYMGVRVDECSRIQRADGPFDNLFAAGEIMSGNVLTRGYLAGFGMTIGSVWGRIAGREAANA